MKRNNVIHPCKIEAVIIGCLQKSDYKHDVRDKKIHGRICNTRAIVY